MCLGCTLPGLVVQSVTLNHWLASPEETWMKFNTRIAGRKPRKTPGLTSLSCWSWRLQRSLRSKQQANSCSATFHAPHYSRRSQQSILKYACALQRFYDRSRSEMASSMDTYRIIFPFQQWPPRTQPLKYRKILMTSPVWSEFRVVPFTK